jgi:hypothetical protein
MKSSFRFGVVFFMLLLVFVIVNYFLATKLMAYAVTSCGVEPHFMCVVFDIIHKWYWVIALLVSGLAAFVSTFVGNRNAA